MESGQRHDWTRVRRFLVRYSWAGVVLGVLFGSGVVWQYFDWQQKQRAGAIDELRAANEIHDRLQVVQNDVMKALPAYISLRDQWVRVLALVKERPWDNDVSVNEYQVRIRFDAETARLVALVHEYNRLECTVSGMEGRPARFFAVPMPPGPVTGMREVGPPNKQGLRAIEAFVPPADPLVEAARSDARAGCGGLQ